MKTFASRCSSHEENARDEYNVLYEHNAKLISREHPRRIFVDLSAWYVEVPMKLSKPHWANLCPQLKITLNNCSLTDKQGYEV